MSHTSPFRTMHDLPVGAVCWTEGFWADRFQLVHSTTLPSMRQAMDDPSNGAVFGNFYVAAGLKTGEHEGTFWSDGDCYKWMEAASHIYGLIHDAALDQQLDDLIAVIAQAQDDDGYICTQVQLTGKERWQKKNHHELYNMGHLLTAACVHYRVTGKDNFLDVAAKLADYLYCVFEPRPPELAHFGWNPSQIMGLVDLYRTTGDTRYLDLAEIFVSMRGSISTQNKKERVGAAQDSGDQNQDRVSLCEEEHAVGHAVTATYLYAGAVDVYAETGKDVLIEALERIWQSAVRRKMYITGGMGTCHHGVSRRGDRIHEAYGLEYQLPNATAYNETCANIGNAMWNWRLLNVTGDAKYADVMEQVLYNSGLSPFSADGQHFCYTNPLRWHGSAHAVLSHDTPERWRTHDCYCCPPQVARTLAGLYNWAYSFADHALWVHLYGSNQLEMALPDGSMLNLIQKTEYPWDGQIQLTVQLAPSERYRLMLRIPGWAVNATLFVNGQPADIEAKPGTYAALERVWAAGDVVKLLLPMQARLMSAHPNVEEARNQAAVMRGPLVYCLESIDLPQGMNITQVCLPLDMDLDPRHDPVLLGGMTVLEGEARYIPAKDWGEQLYRPLPVGATQSFNLILIPYYAWNNRGTTEMTVWLPVSQ